MIVSVRGRARARARDRTNYVRFFVCHLCPIHIICTYADRVFYTVQLIYNAADRLTVIARGPHPVYNVLLLCLVADGLRSYIQGDNSPGVRSADFLPPPPPGVSYAVSETIEMNGRGKKLFFQRQSVLIILYFRREIFFRHVSILNGNRIIERIIFFYVNSGHTVWTTMNRDGWCTLKVRRSKQLDFCTKNV